MKRIGVIEMDEHNLRITCLSLAKSLKRFFNRRVGHLLLRPSAQFVRAPKRTVDQSNVHIEG